MAYEPNIEIVLEAAKRLVESVASRKGGAA